MSSEKTQEMDQKTTSDEVSEDEKDLKSQKKKSEENEKTKTQTEEVENENESKEVEEENEKDLRIAQLEDELKSAKDSLLRKAAELENVRKRVQRERIQLFEEAKAGALEDFMPISDDLNRTLKAAEESKVESNFLKGVTMVADKFQEVLEKHGVERINKTGVPFDVNIHDAMLKQPAPDEDTKSDIVLDVLESGYKIGNRTIRHAKVIVSE